MGHPQPGERWESPAGVSFVAVALLFAVLGTVFELRWETNDDVGMAMAAHGFGLATHGSPNLIYSNVLWGHLVRALPPIGGVLGYSIAALLAMLLSGWTLLHGLRRLGAGWAVAGLATVLAIVPAVLAPQFTITAGLLTLAAVVAATVYARHGGRRHLLFAALLGLAGFLVRFESFLLVLAVASPLLPWRTLISDRALQLTVAAAGLAILAATAIDRQAYAGPEWAPFLALETPRAEFTDFNAGDRLRAERPEIAMRHGYSANDIALVENYFFADPAIADPAKLAAMVAEIGPPQLHAGGLRSGAAGLAATWHPRLLPLLACGLGLLALRPRWRLAAAWALFLLAIFAVGFGGRPGILRVYVAPLCLLAVMPLATLAGDPTRWRRLAATAIVGVAAGWQLWNILPPALAARVQVARVQQNLLRAPPGTLVAWGGAFPYIDAYPVLSADARLRAVRLYSLGTDTLAPYAVAVADEETGRGFVSRLTGADGVPVVLFDRHLPLLRRYCREHLGGSFEGPKRWPLPSVRVLTVKCALKGSPPSPPHPEAPETRQ